MYYIFLSWRSIPHSRARRKTQFPTPKLLIDLIYIFCYIRWSAQKEIDMLSQLLWTFSWVYWEKDNGCHNVVKTWSINLKTKTKKKNCLNKSASLMEHFMRTLDRSVFLSTYQKPWIRFHMKTYQYLKLSWINISVLPFQKIKSIGAHIIYAHLFKFSSKAKKDGQKATYSRATSRHFSAELLFPVCCCAVLKSHNDIGVLLMSVTKLVLT